jgi:2-polyprenyl-3-methyl-5-hydroxy-6-metoxy-1,4-benzoquinol methylase
MNKLVVVIIGQNCERFIHGCIQSSQGADSIVYLDGGSKDKTLEIVKDFNNVLILENKWDKYDKTMNGKQRNFYLDYLKNNYQNWWCLVLDADEVVEDIEKVKEFIKEIDKKYFNCFSVKMRHFIGDLGHEDGTKQIHYVPNRLFRINKAKSYPLHSHPVLETEGDSYNTICTTIWHLGHLPIEYMRYIVNRYNQHKEDSIIHDIRFLNWWRDSHLFGKYPIGEIDPRDIPKIVYEEIGLNFDEVYSEQEKLEFKHHLMVKQWFDLFNPTSVLDLGCGRGAYLFYWNWFVKEIKGYDINKWAIENSFIPGKVEIRSCEDIDINWDLITCIDVLEHLDDRSLIETLLKISEHGNKFIFSIPFIGDPNLEKDKTHIQKKTREEWVKLIEDHGIKVIPTPDHWLFKEQIIIGIK